MSRRDKAVALAQRRNVEVHAKSGAKFLPDESAEDLLEYALLVAFVTLAGGCTASECEDERKRIWDEQTEAVSKANQSASRPSRLR
jgi:Flp pilus assembly pilin Flp